MYLTLSMISTTKENCHKYGDFYDVAISAKDKDSDQEFDQETLGKQFDSFKKAERFAISLVDKLLYNY